MSRSATKYAPREAHGLSRAVRKYSPDQPRDERGRWSSGEGGPTADEVVRHPPRVARALMSHKPSTRAKQRAAAISVHSVAGLVGGKPTDDHEPMDVVIRDGRRTIGIEVKTLLDNTNDKITMHPESLARKMGWLKEHRAVGHTVVVDKRGSVAQWYHRLGFGSFRMTQMRPISRAQLRRLLRSE